jgi:hypothetical protein
LGRKKITQRNGIVDEILFNIIQLTYKDCKIKIAWIPAHINISGNESADREAKQGHMSSDLIVVGLCSSEIKSAIRKIIDVEWRAAWDYTKKGRHPHRILNKPSRHYQIRGELKIPINKKLLPLKLVTCYFRIEELICHTCNVPNDITHFLIDCQKFDLQRADFVSICTNNGIVLYLLNVLRTNNTALIRLVTQFISRSKAII